MNPASNILPTLSVSPQSSTAATLTGSWVDVSNFDFVLGTVAVGAIAASTTVDAKIQVSDDQSNVVDGESITQLGATDDNKLGIKISYRRRQHGAAKKYARLVITIAGSGSALVCGILTGANPAQAPV